jgi:ribosomal protein L7/L12
MDQTKLNSMRLRTHALAMAIRGHFRAASEGDAEVLEALASQCEEDIDELSHAPATKVVLVAYGDRKIEVIKELRALTGLGLKESKDLVEAAPVALSERFAVADADKFKRMLEGVGATVLLI